MKRKRSTGVFSQSGNISSKKAIQTMRFYAKCPINIRVQVEMSNQGFVDACIKTQTPTINFYGQYGYRPCDDCETSRFIKENGPEVKIPKKLLPYGIKISSDKKFLDLKKGCTDKSELFKHGKKYEYNTSYQNSWGPSWRD